MPQRAPHKPEPQAPAYEFLTRADIAERFHLTEITVTRCYARWGLRPMRISGRVLFPSTQVDELERRLIESGEPL